MLEIREESPRSDESRVLLAASDAYAAALYPAESNHMVDVEVLAAPGTRFFVARIAGRAVGCGAVVAGAEEHAREIKRMFVGEAARGHGVGKALLHALEEAARAAGAKALRLETGVAQPEALGLYRRAGYCERSPFGDYREDPLSLYFEKAL